jgi:hypothetical protein
MAIQKSKRAKRLLKRFYFLPLVHDDHLQEMHFHVASRPSLSAEFYSYSGQEAANENGL